MAETPPPEIVALVKENFEWWNGGEPELMVDSYTEDAELDLSVVFRDMPVMRGQESIRRQTQEFWSTWEGLKMESFEMIDLGGRRYVVVVRLWGRGKRSGAEVDQRFAFLYTLHPERNKVVRAQLFPNAQAAIDHTAAAAHPGPSDLV